MLIEVDCLPEHDAIDDYFHFPEDARAVKALAGQTPWGWCCVRVTVSCGELEASEYLHCCSYGSEEDFRRRPHYTDMVAKATEQLKSRVSDLMKELEALSYGLPTLTLY